MVPRPPQGAANAHDVLWDHGDRDATTVEPRDDDGDDGGSAGWTGWDLIQLDWCARLEAPVTERE